MPPKECPPGKVLNPATNRCVKADGKIGRALAAAKPNAAKPNAAKKAETPKKERLLREIAKRCNNDSDPISMDSFADMTVEQLESLVYIGKGTKKNCYLLDNIHEVYRTAVLGKKKARDPMDPSHELSDGEIREINRLMKARDASYKTPRYVTPRPYPKGWELDISMSALYPNYFDITVRHHGTIKFDLGLVPAWVETHHTGSADNTSGVLASNLRELWDRKLLMAPASGPLPYTCCCSGRLVMGRSFGYWQGSTWKSRFVELCNSVRDALAT